MQGVLRRVLAVLFVGICLCSEGAELKVRSFEYAPMDLTARLNQRLDLNNNPCAVIVVHLPVAGAFFEGNVIGEPVFRGSEYRVYVSGGTKMMKVLCPGVESVMVDLTDSTGKTGVESLGTYHLRLDGYESALGTQQQVYTGPQKGYVVMEITPAVTAMVEIDGKMRTVSGGTFKELLDYGTYPFTVMAEGFARYTGSATLSSDEGVKVKVALKSVKSLLRINSVTEGVSLSINGTPAGKTPFASDILAGSYLIEATKAGYMPYKTSVEIAESTPVEVSIPALTPMYGALNIDYEPVGATISVDGEVKGVTPKILSQVLEGSHSVTISHNGYKPVTKTMNVIMGETATLTGKLEEVNEVELTLKEQYGKYGYVDKNGNVVIPFKYDYAWEFSEGLAAVKQNDKWGFIDKSDNVVIPLKYDIAWEFKEGLAVVEQNGKFGYIDKSGNVAIPFKYDWALPFSEGLAMVKQNGKYGYVDKSGNVVIPFKYDYALSFSEGLAKVRQNGKYGYIDKSGNVVIPLIYDSADSFSEGLAFVKQNGKYGFVDKSGNVVIPIKYDDAKWFYNGFAEVKYNGSWRKINKKGNFVD